MANLIYFMLTSLDGSIEDETGKFEAPDIGEPWIRTWSKGVALLRTHASAWCW
jgi:hypothetical protein